MNKIKQVKIFQLLKSNKANFHNLYIYDQFNSTTFQNIQKKNYSYRLDEDNSDSEEFDEEEEIDKSDRDWDKLWINIFQNILVLKEVNKDFKYTNHKKL